MRVTAATKEATRQEILEAARQLFASQGFESTTTRDISHRAGIATGTLFNYFPTKEAIVGYLVAEALTKAREEFERRPCEAATLEEALFAHVATGLRKLKPLRKFLAPALDAVVSPGTTTAATEYAESVRAGHLEDVACIVAEYDLTDALSAHSLTLYWMLYTGVLAWWTTDKSPKQEDTLALLDESIHMFVTWLTH